MRCFLVKFMRKKTIHSIAVMRMLFALGLAFKTPLHAQTEDTQVLGPILTWHHDPTSEVTVTWLELGNKALDMSGATADAQWREGESGFGYGDGDDVTQIVMRGKHTALYTRTAFDLAKRNRAAIQHGFRSATTTVSSHI